VILKNPEAFRTSNPAYLTDSEALVLALIGSAGADGLDQYHPGLEGNLPVLASLDRFGLIANPWVRDRGFPYILTDDGEATYQATRTALWNYGTCAACVRLACVCSHRIGCLRGGETPHANLGCNGSHD